jgi:hypothetical protein
MAILFKLSVVFLVAVLVLVLIQFIYISGYIKCKCGRCSKCVKHMWTSYIKPMTSPCGGRQGPVTGSESDTLVVGENNPMGSSSPTSTAHLLCSDTDRLGAADGEAPSFMLSEKAQPLVITSPHKSVATLGCIRSHI